jgi:hypothetical protein
MVENCADLYNKHHRDPEDGATPYKRVKGRLFGGETFPFGSRVWHRTPGKLAGGVVGERWHEGVWLGSTFNSNEHIVSMPDGK